MNEEKTKNPRLMSLDALRGLDMLLITGLPALLAAIIGGVCGHPNAWILKTMQHASWEGFNVMDTVFPLFMFISGIAFPYSYAAQVAKGRPQAKIVGKIVWRTVALVLLGLLYNKAQEAVFLKGLEGVRFSSVLARIGLAWGAAAALYVFFGLRMRIAVAVSILLGYWAFCAFVPVPGAPAGSNPFGAGLVSWPGWLDSCIWLDGKPDPEGVLSTLPAIVTTMGGVFTGELIRSERFSGNAKTLLLLGAALVCGLLAWVWSPWCPIVKRLWTPSFVLAAWSYSLAWFGIFYWLVDVRMWRSWTFFFRVIGVNSILIYFLRRMVYLQGIANYLFGGFAQWLGAPWQGVVEAAAFILVAWLILFLFYRKGIFLKI